MKLESLLAEEKYWKLFLHIEEYIKRGRQRKMNPEYELIGLNNLREIQVYAILSKMKETGNKFTKYQQVLRLENFLEKHNIRSKYPQQQNVMLYQTMRDQL